LKFFDQTGAKAKSKQAGSACENSSIMTLAKRKSGKKTKRTVSPALRF